VTNAEMHLIHPGDEHELWVARPSRRALYLPLMLSSLVVAVGVLVIWDPFALLVWPSQTSAQRIIPALVLIGSGIVLGFIIYWLQQPLSIHYQLTDRQLRIFVGAKLVKRVVRGELRSLSCRGYGPGGSMITWAATHGFSGNPSGFTQQAGNRLMGIHDAGRVLARLAHWTLGDEAEAERIAAEFLADANARGREIRELGTGLRLCLPTHWPAEGRCIERRPLRLLGRKLPIGSIQRGALLRLGDEPGFWQGLRVRASERSGLYLEISSRTGDQDQREVCARWAAPRPLDLESVSIPIAGFSGVMAVQTADASSGPRLVPEPARQWSADGYEDEGFGYVARSAHRILLWATDGEIAIQIRAYAPAADSHSARAIMRIIHSLRRDKPLRGA
jgi:hypothetical protein